MNIPCRSPDSGARLCWSNIQLTVDLSTRATIRNHQNVAFHNKQEPVAADSGGTAVLRCDRLGFSDIERILGQFFQLLGDPLASRLIQRVYILLRIAGDLYFQVQASLCFRGQPSPRVEVPPARNQRPCLADLDSSSTLQIPPNQAPHRHGCTMISRDRR